MHAAHLGGPGPRPGMISPELSVRRHAVHMVGVTGDSTQLTGLLPWRECRVVLSCVRRIFTDREARARGWIVTPAPRGFVASRGEVCVSFSIADALELVGSPPADRSLEMTGRGRKSRAAGGQART
jgi:hypothetical protein